jgi:hypothetical protein
MEPYPQFSLITVTTLWTMLRERTVRDNPKSFAKHLYVLLGAALGLLVGEPDDVQPLFGDAEEADDATLEGLLGELKAAQEDGIAETFGAAEGEQAIDPATLAILINLAVTLIQKIIERRKNRS